MGRMACGQVLRICGLIFLGLVSAGCGEDSNTRVATLVPGLGNDPGDPTGDAYTPPAGVSILSAVGADHANNKSIPVCGGASGLNGTQSTGDVDLCVTLRNDAAQATAVTLPNGLIFLAKESTDPTIRKSQNGLLGQTITLSLPPGQSTFIVRLYCVNRGAPSSDRPSGVNDTWPQNWEYDTTPIVTDYPQLREVARVIDTKSLAYEHAVTIQGAVWDVTETQDGTGRTADQRLADALAKLDTVPGR